MQGDLTRRSLMLTGAAAAVAASLPAVALPTPLQSPRTLYILHNHSCYGFAKGELFLIAASEGTGKSKYEQRHPPQA